MLKMLENQREPLRIYTMKILMLFLILQSPIKESFQNRNYWRVVSLHSQARDRSDSILILLAARRTLRKEINLKYLTNLKNLPTELLLALTGNIYSDSNLDSITLANLVILRDSIIELRDYFSLKIIEKLVKMKDPYAALHQINDIKDTKIRKQALNTILAYVLETKNVNVLDSIFFYSDDFEDISKLCEILKTLWAGDTLKARQMANSFAKTHVNYPYLIKIIDLFDDTLKAYIYYQNAQYRDADKIFRRIKTEKYLQAQLLSAYRTRDYKYFVELFENKRNLINTHDLENMLLQIGYAYWQSRKPIKALEYLSYSANRHNELAAREIFDILVKENSGVLEEFIKNVQIRSQELNYTIGLYLLYKGDTLNAKAYLKEATDGKNNSIKIKSSFFFSQLTGEYLNLKSEENRLDYFYLYLNGLEVSREKEPVISYEETRKIKIFRYLLLWGDAREALKYVEDFENSLLSAIKIADELGYDHIKINLALRYLNLKKFEKIPLYLLKWIFPTNYYPTIKPVAQFYNIRPELVLALMREESRFNPEAVSNAGAIGLMQLMPNTAKSLYPEVTIDSLEITDINITLGIKYLSALSDTFPNIIDVLSAYNAGSARVRQWRKTYNTKDPYLYMECIPFKETREYVQRVLRSIIIYEYLLKETEND